jgi:hypothetical protein
MMAYHGSMICDLEPNLFYLCAIPILRIGNQSWDSESSPRSVSSTWLPGKHKSALRLHIAAQRLTNVVRM